MHYTSAEVQLTCAIPTLPTPLQLQHDLLMQISAWLTWQSANSWPSSPLKARLWDGTIELQRRRGLPVSVICSLDFLGVVAGCGAFGFARRTLGMNHSRRTYFPLLWYASRTLRIVLCILNFASGIWCLIARLIQLCIAFTCFRKKDLPPRPESGWTLFARV